MWLISPHGRLKVRGAQLGIQLKRPIDQRTVALPDQTQAYALELQPPYGLFQLHAVAREAGELVHDKHVELLARGGGLHGKVLRAVKTSCGELKPAERVPTRA
jgi:hypothetical protein